MTSYIIHLARAVERAPNVARLQGILPGPVHMLDAVDARALTGDLGARRRLHFPPYPFALRPAEIACLHSHRLAWKTILEGPDDTALVVEDDCTFDPVRFPAALSLARAQATPESYIRFPIRTIERPAEELAQDGATRLFRPQVTGLGAQAQLVGRAAAARLLEATQRFDRPVDTLLQMTWITGQTMHCVLPSGVSEISREIGGSTIGTRLSPGARLGREIARPLYRLALRATARVRAP
ncbi:glycosyltransferase family 25 protein [Salipiger sp. IMCC34102]|uniref:glycosyltransferase family 25 protein n=1 Tax=Salipiger sp. IMCC34102 TaxID=2510647 RepID=UPI00101CEE8D|nr:glycosyltransferase family 25 protein [Salipiger sp. IMCC34102]RYH03283.1 glycosyltransferase family 25 protein [Salipiger sp. IMCC34102]